MSERYRAGLDNLMRLSGDTAELVSDQVAAEAPEFVRLMVEFAFADILARPGLDLRARLLVAIGVLAARDRTPPQLRWFVRSALRAGIPAAEIVETLMQVSVFAGFANATNALETCADLLCDQSPSAASCPVPISAP